MTDTGTIPQSNALAEAGSDSMAEVYNRDPEKATRQDRDRIVAGLREQRVRLQQAEQAGVRPKAKKAVSLDQKISGTAEDLGL